MLKILDQDSIFFDQHKDRQAHIRNALPNESSAEFMSLGPHNHDRRRIIAWKVPAGSEMAVGQILKIPFLAFQDEEIRDEDSTLLPVIHELMMDAAKKYQIPVPKKPR